MMKLRAYLVCTAVIPGISTIGCHVAFDRDRVTPWEVRQAAARARDHLLGVGVELADLNWSFFTGHCPAWPACQ